MADQRVVEALTDYTTPLSSVDPRDFDDPQGLEAIAEQFAGADVVGLGEATHGTREFFAVRHRLTRFLVERCGFRTVVLEAEAGSVTTAGEYVLGGEGRPAAALEALRPWWRTEGMAAFLRWLREFNEGRPDDDRVRLYGVDVGDPSEAATAVRSLLAAVDPDYYRTVKPVVDPLADGEALERGGPDDPEFFERAETVASDVADRIDRYRNEGETERSARELATLAFLARAVGGTCEWYRGGGAAEGLNADGYERRDRVMADNAARLARRRDGGVAFWGHNGHVMRGTFDDGRPWSDAETAGECLDGEFGDGYRAIGTEFARGRFRAIDGTADDGGFETFEAEDPPGESLAGLLAERGQAPLFFDLAAAHDDPELGPWLDRRRRIRNVEVAYDPTADRGYYAETELPASFDGVVFLDGTRPVRSTGVAPGE